MFDREHELVAALARQHRRLWPAARTRRVRAEHGYGAGVPDLVVLDFDPPALARRLPGLGPLGLSSEALLVAALRAVGPTPPGDLRALLERRLSAATISRTVARMTASGHLVQAGGLVRVGDDLLPVLDRLIAIEAKLGDWRRGMEQAVRYREFANQTYLALPAPLAERLAAAERSRLELWRIGLIAVTPAASRIVVGCGRAEPGHGPMRAWAEEVELADLLGLSPRLMRPFTPRFTAPSPLELVSGAA